MKLPFLTDILSFFLTEDQYFALLNPWVLLLILIPLFIPTVPYWRHKISTIVTLPITKQQKIGLPLTTFAGLGNWSILIILTVAASQPITIHNDIRATSIQSANVILLDISPSMQEYVDTNERAQHGRYIELAKQQINDILKQSNRLYSLVVFSDQATVLAPLTLDRQAIAQTLNLARVQASNAQTSITQGLLLSLEVLDTADALLASDIALDSSSVNRIPKRVILFSDGQNNADISRLAELNQSLQQNNIALVIYLFHAFEPEVLENLKQQLPNAIFAQNIEAEVIGTDEVQRIHPWAKITHHYPSLIVLALLLILLHWGWATYHQLYNATNQHHA